nr:MAG TPA: hypothetical protein [Caudoviricetes sp.]
MLMAKCLKEDADKILEKGCIYLVDQVGCDVLVHLPHGINRYLGMFPASWFAIVQQ